MKHKTPSTIWSNPIHFLAFGCGVGALPYAPGTFGTLLAIPLYLLVQDLPLWLYVTNVALLFVIGLWLCHITSRDINVHDHAGIVWDEIVGYLITMTAAPEGWPWVLLGFALFRLFDIWKPWPISVIDRKTRGGVGIMCDDGLAGIFALVSLQTIAYLVAHV